MKFEYRYPALIRGLPPRCGNRRAALCLMTGAVDVPEYGEADVPVACVVDHRHSPRGPEEYRVLDGRFYRSAMRAEHIAPMGVRERGSRHFEWETDLFRRMIAVAGSLFYRAQSPVDLPVWPKSASQCLSRGTLWANSGAFDLYGDWRSDWTIDAISVDDLRDADAGDIEFFRATADALAAEAIIVDGWLWTSVDEPVLYLDHRKSGVFSLEHRRFFEAASVNSSAQPYPFGRGSHLDKTEAHRSYWRWDSEAYSMNDHAVAEGILSRNDPDAGLSVEVRMPEVFGHGFAEMELVRIARGVSSQLAEIFMQGVEEDVPSRIRWDPSASKELRLLLEEIARLAVGAPSYPDLQRLAGKLEELAADFPDYPDLLDPDDGQRYLFRPTMIDMPDRIAKALLDFDTATVRIADVAGETPTPVR